MKKPWKNRLVTYRYRRMSNGGAFSRADITEVGLEVLEVIKRFVEYKIEYRGCSSNNTYFKWARIQNGVDIFVDVSACRDYLLEKGFEAEVIIQKGARASVRGSKERKEYDQNCKEWHQRMQTRDPSISATIFIQTNPYPKAKIDQLEYVKLNVR